MQHFNSVVGTIRWTHNYPRDGINFCDLSQTFGTPALAELAKITVKALCIDVDHVIVGVPTRGVVWAALLASVSGARAFFLSKEGVGTPAPGIVPFCAAGTVYSGDQKTKFNIHADDLAAIKRAPVVWVADDVCESGSTLRSVMETIGPTARGIPLISFRDEFHHVIYFDGIRCFPGRRVFESVPGLLCTLRGGTTEIGERGHPFVYGLPSMDHLVRSYVTNKRGARVGDVQWNTFPGGMPNIHFDVPSFTAVFIYDASADTTTQDGLVHALARSCETLEIIVSYLPQGTMERVDQEGTLAIAQTRLHSLCAAMPVGCARVTVTVYDIHQTGTRFYTGDTVRYRPISMLDSLVAMDCDIAFPDDGACKRFRHLFPGRNLLIFSKKRGPDGKRIIELNEMVGDSQAKSVTIVDDLVRTGGTILSTARILKINMGYDHVTAAFVHADFDPGTLHAFVHNSVLDAICTTDTVPEKARALQLSAPNKVSVFGIFEGLNINLTTTMDADTVLLILASTSETKYHVLRSICTSVYTLHVPNGPNRPEQPMSSAEGEAALRDRIDFVSYVWPTANVFAAESYIQNSYDAVCAMFSKGKHIGHSSEYFNVPVPTEFMMQCSNGKITAGEFMQKAWNLESKDAWIRHMGKTRDGQIRSALNKAKI